MRLRLIALSLIAALTSTFVLTLAAQPAAAQAPGIEVNIPVDAIESPENLQLTDGTLTITRLNLQGNQLVADGMLTGTVNGTDIDQDFNNVPLSVGTDDDTAACDILLLDLGPIFLGALGLQVDLSEIMLDVTAVPGAGNLLGNLLCAVAGLLDPQTGGDDQGILQQLLNIINRLL